MVTKRPKVLDRAHYDFKGALLPLQEAAFALQDVVVMSSEHSGLV